MKKDKEKYETPETKKSQVSLENGICQSSVNPKNPNEDNGRIEEHEVNDNFNFDFSNQDWDSKN